MKDLVSVLVPSYNHEKYILDCVESVLGQSYDNIELIVIDDYSTDRTYEIVKSVAKRCEERGFHFYCEKNKENIGVTKTYNKLLQLANGKFIKLLGSDDILLPDCIQNYVDYYYSTGERYDILVSNAYKIDQEIHYPIQCDLKLTKVYSNSPDFSGNITGRICARNFIIAPTAFIPKATYEKYGVYNEEYCLEDYEYWLRVSETGSIGCLDMCTVCYRVLSDSLSHYYRQSRESLERYERVNKDRNEIFGKYERYCSTSEKEIYFNDSLTTAISINADRVVNECIQNLYSCGLNMSFPNKVRLFLYRIKLYGLARDIKCFFRCVYMKFRR